jgi:hypothetical protein
MERTLYMRKPPSSVPERDGKPPNEPGVAMRHSTRRASANELGSVEAAGFRTLSPTEAAEVNGGLHVKIFVGIDLDGNAMFVEFDIF